MPTLVVAALLAGAGVWVYTEVHPGAPIVNHAVAPAAPSTGAG